MKLGPDVCLFVFAMIATSATACTIQTTAPSDAGTSSTGSDAATDTQGTADGGTSADASSSDSSTATASAPKELVGPTWSWVTSSGGEALVFTADGKYTSDVYVNAHPGDSCGTEYFTHRAGSATFSGATLALAPSTAQRTKRDSCTDKVLADDAIAPEIATYTWRIEDGSTGQRVLVLTTGDGYEARYFPDPG